MKLITPNSWQAPLAGGFLFPILLWGGLRLMYPPINPEVVAAARKLGIEPRIYNDASTLFEKAEKTQNVSEPEWLRLNQYLSDPKYANVNLQNEVLGAFALLRHSCHEEEIKSIGREYVQGKKPELRVGALILLWKLHDPSWRERATEMARDTHDAEERVVITHILEKGDRP